MTPATPSRLQMQRALLARDASYDGVFFAGVVTTGIFCRPSCPARKPRPENVEYFPTAARALFAGYRPCRRCEPLRPPGAAPEWVAGLLARIESDPTARIRDADLRDRGLDPARVRRHFQRHYGLTFQALCRARRLAAAFSRLRNGDGLDSVAYAHGYESVSGFREAFGRVFGDAPGRSRDRRLIVLGWIPTRLGPLVAGATDEGVCLLEYSDRRMLETQLAALRRRFGRRVVPGEHEHLDRLRAQVEAYLQGERREFDVPLATPGTPFQESVWRALRTIPYGTTWSYRQLAAAVGRPAAVRAVARANGMNRVAILVPCHRVVGSDGALTGYGGGVWRKRLLLDLERAPQAPGRPGSAAGVAASAG